MAAPSQRTRLAGVLIALACGGAACASGPTGFDGARARAHLDMLAGTIGSRPIGTPANARAREYVIDQLKQAGFTVRVQEAEARYPAAGLTAPVVNVIALREGSRPDAIALVSHYDSQPEAMGAVDDGIGVATCLEAARVLSRERLTHSLLVLVTDGEESGLMGARAIVLDRDVTTRLRAFLNFDGTGAAGPSLLFETGPGWTSALSAWAAHAAAPSGASFATEIYKRLPNDTDFSILKGTSALGLNFAPVGDAYAYHTDRDEASRVQPGLLQSTGDNTITIVRALDAAGFSSPGGSPTYFDVARRRGVVFGAKTTAAIAWAAVALGALLWFLLTIDGRRARGWGGLTLTALWGLLMLVVTAAAMIGAAWLLRTSRAEFNPWYASPGWFFGCLTAIGLAAVWAIGRLASLLPERVRPWREPVGVWWVTIPLWIGLTVFFQLGAPSASYLTSLPLLIAGVLILLGRRPATVTRAASAAIFVVAALLWADKTIMLLRFVVPLFGWLSIPAPVFAYPALIFAAGLMIVPPFAAALRHWQTGTPRTQTGAALAAAVAITGIAAYLSPAYTEERPLRRSVRYVQDDVSHQAWWEIAGSEPTVGVDSTSLAGHAWLSVTDAPPASLPLPRIDGAFRHRAPAAPAVATLPADLRSSLSKDSTGRTVLEVVVTPHEWLAATLVLPPGIRPAASPLTGRVSSDRWVATYLAPPPAGVTLRVEVEPRDADALKESVVVLAVTGLPGGAGRLRLPAWLPQAGTTWIARSQFIVPLTPRP